MLEPFGDHELQFSLLGIPWFRYPFCGVESPGFSKQTAGDLQMFAGRRSKINHYGRNIYATENSSYV